MGILTSDQMEKKAESVANKEKEKIKAAVKKEYKRNDRFKFPNAPMGKAKAFFEYGKETYEVEIIDKYAKFPKMNEDEKQKFRGVLSANGFIDESYFENSKKESSLDKDIKDSKKK